MQHKDKFVQMAGKESARSEVIEYRIHEMDRNILSGRRTGRTMSIQRTDDIVERRRPRMDGHMAVGKIVKAGDEAVKAEKVEAVKEEVKEQPAQDTPRRSKKAMVKSSIGVSNRVQKKKTSR